MLQIDGLTKYFGQLPAVYNLSFHVAPGEIVGLLGPNGAGKTTSLRCIASILQPSHGRILINGFDLGTQTEDAKRSLAYVPEVPNPYEMLTVMEHLRFVAAAFRAEGELVHAEELLKRMDLWEKRNDLAATLSKGMRQKLACVCGFIHKPKMICLDEPLIGLDPKGARELKNLLVERRAAGDAILVSTHQLDTAERLCDRVIIMNKGQVLVQGTLAELHQRAQLATDATLEDIFLNLTEGAEPTAASWGGGAA
jgi:ABC-2 type transport system ATP-binding protein